MQNKNILDSFIQISSSKRRLNVNIIALNVLLEGLFSFTPLRLMPFKYIVTQSHKVMSFHVYGIV